MSGIRKDNMTTLVLSELGLLSFAMKWDARHPTSSFYRMFRTAGVASVEEEAVGYWESKNSKRTRELDHTVTLLWTLCNLTPICAHHIKSHRECQVLSSNSPRMMMRAPPSPEPVTVGPARAILTFRAQEKDLSSLPAVPVRSREPIPQSDSWSVQAGQIPGG
jgi:hypothetical protein